jgi:hypothetical protein
MRKREDDRENYIMRAFRCYWGEKVKEHDIDVGLMTDGG